MTEDFHVKHLYSNEDDKQVIFGIYKDGSFVGRINSQIVMMDGRHVPVVRLTLEHIDKPTNHAWGINAYGFSDEELAKRQRDDFIMRAKAVARHHLLVKGESHGAS